jgi:hypothetical protein
MAKWTYHKQHSYIEVKTGTKSTLSTQLYFVGVYCILDNNPLQQFSLKPSKLVKIEKKLKEEQEKGIIKDLVFTNPITVTKTDNGFEKIV